jgi:hypothetical protein
MNMKRNKRNEAEKEKTKNIILGSCEINSKDTQKEIADALLL